jgi:hypothetical protein
MGKFDSDTKPTISTTVLDVIYTFEDSPQLQGQVTFAGRPSEAQLVKGLLNGLSTEQTKNLVKISTCQLYCGSDGVLPWKTEDNARKGKYYFSTHEDVETDEPPISLN